MRFLKLNEMEINKEIHLVSRLVLFFLIGLFSPIFFSLFISFCFQLLCFSHSFRLYSSLLSVHFNGKNIVHRTNGVLWMFLVFGGFFTVRVMHIRRFVCACGWACVWMSERAFFHHHVNTKQNKNNQHYVITGKVGKKKKKKKFRTKRKKINKQNSKQTNK